MITVPFALEPCTTTLTRHVNPLPFVPEDGAECSEHCDEIILLAALGLKKRMEHSGAQAAVVGLSGGLDSTLAILITSVAMRLMDRPASDMIAVTMPCFGTTERTRDNAVELAERLGISSQYVNDIEQGKKCMSMAIFVELGEVFHTGLDELAHGAQKEEPVLEHLLCHLRQLSPVQRDMAVHMLHLAFRAAQELGPEE